MKTSLGAKTLAHPTPTWVVGTYDHDGKPNVATVAWAGICCSQPPCVAVSLRKATYSYGNIVERKAFTVNVPSVAHVKETDYFGLVSGRDVAKLAAAKLTPVASQLVDAPFIDQFPLVLECRLLHTLEIGLHTQFVGEILDVKADPKVLDEKGRLDVQKIRPFVFAPGDRTYHALGPLLAKAFSIGKELQSEP